VIPLPGSNNGGGPTTGYDPLNYWAEPIEAQFLEEIKNNKNDFPGVDAIRVVYSGLKEKNTANQWISDPFRVCDPGCHEADGWDWVWKNKGPGSTCFAQQNDLNNSTSFQVWTYPSNHACS
jgi:hypothetical protein